MRAALCAVVWISGLYVAYAIAAGYVGGTALPEPLNLIAALAVLAVAAATTIRLIQPRA